MNADESPDADEMITRVVDAFERMPVPPVPDLGQLTALASGPAAARAGSAAGPGRSRRWFAGLSRRQQLAAGGIGLSSAAGLLLVLLALNSGRELSAMERMVRELQEIKSYSYKITSSNTFYDDGKHDPTVVTEEAVSYWAAPDAFHEEVKIVRADVAASGKAVEEIVEDFASVYPAGKLGMYIDHKYKVYRWLPNDPMGSTIYPLEMLQLIRENSGEITRDLGSKEIEGRQAHGYVIVLKGWRDWRERGGVRDPVEVWVDAATDLPLEFSYNGKHEEPGQNGAGYWFRATDFRWNIALDEKLFAPQPPEGYTDITPPSGEKEIAEIADALALYAELSGGHYPQVKQFDAAAVHNEMLKLAGFAGPAKEEWKEDKQYRRIEQAARGLDWIGRIVRNRYHSGSDGLTVGPQDKDKLLLWWTLFAPVRFRVFYGDLRQEILSDDAGKKLGLADAWTEKVDDEQPTEAK